MISGMNKAELTWQEELEDLIRKKKEESQALQKLSRSLLTPIKECQVADINGNEETDFLPEHCSKVQEISLNQSNHQ